MEQEVLQLLKYESISGPNLHFFIVRIILLHLYKKYYYLFYIGISRYEKCFIGNLSVSADMKIEYIDLYRYRPI